MDIFFHVLIKIFLIGLGMMLKVVEVALPSAPDDELTVLAQRGNKSARRVLKLCENSVSYVASIRTAISTVEFISSALAVIHFAHYISDPLTALGIPAIVSESVGILVVSFIYVTVTVIMIALVARHIALKNPLKSALRFSLFAYLISKLFLPFSAFISICSKGILKIMGINPTEKEKKNATEEAIKNLVDTGTESGTINDEEKEIIENIFAFDDIEVDRIATHRKEITLLWTNETDAEWEKTVLSSHHSNFPICDEKIDNIVGILSAKEYLRLKNRSRANVMRRAVKSPFYIPEAMKANVALKAMKQKRNYFAVVIDEYGGLSGILTVTDLLQCIVGEIYDGDDVQKAPEIEPLDSKTWMIAGNAEIEDVEDALGITLEGDFETFAGYVLTMVDSIPDDNTTTLVENELMTVKITSVKDHRILKTNVKLKDVFSEEND